MGRPAGAPGPFLQKINASLHVEPLSSIFYCLFWISIFAFVAPIVAFFALTILLIYRLVTWTFSWDGRQEYHPSRHSDKELVVVVTGCDSGFGHEIALWAAEAGYVVFAGCLSEDSFKKFDATVPGKIIPIKLDVTNDGDVLVAARMVSKYLNDPKHTEKKRILHALINNAGIGATGLFDWLEVSDYQRVMDVNYFGVLRCCKAFLPILKQQSIDGLYRGARIMNLTSIAGVLPGNPVGSAYGASKHAAQTVTEALRKELVCFDIDVGSVNPSFHYTPLVESVISGADVERTWNRLSTEVQEQYGSELKDCIKDIGSKWASSLCWDAEVVLDQTVKALSRRSLPAQMYIGMDARYLHAFFKILPGWVIGAVYKDENFMPKCMKNN